MPVSFREHYLYTDEERRLLLSRLRIEILKLDHRLDERITAGRRIAYKKPCRTKSWVKIKNPGSAAVLRIQDGSW